MLTCIVPGGKTHGAPDGGIRVPTVLRWPAAVSRGQVVDEPVSLMDILPTVASLLDVSLPANLHVDGRSLLPLITGKQLRSQHEFLFHYCLSYLHAVRYMPREGECFVDTVYMSFMFLSIMTVASTVSFVWGR